ncbi:MAG: AsmA-like C-terminal region-containing protein [Nibricoccus sp.]
MKLGRFSWFLCKQCVRCTWSFVVWTLWLALVALIVFQLKIGLSRELTVPAWIVQRIENKHAARGIISHVGSATIDPHGHVLLRDVKIYSKLYAEPLVTARSVEAALSPWAILAGDFGASNIRLQGVDLHLPPILSPSGRDESVLTDINLSLEINDRDLTIHQFNARYSGLTIAARGTLRLPADEKNVQPETGVIVEHTLKNYFQAALQLANRAPSIAWFDTPHLDVTLDASSDRVALAWILLTARGARLPASLVSGLPPAESIDLGPFTLSTTLPITSNQPWAARIQLSLAQLAAPGGVQASDAHFSLLAGIAPGWKTTARSLDLALGRLDFHELTATAVAARTTGTFPRLHTALSLNLLDEPWSLSGDLDLSDRSGTVEVASRLSPAVIATVSRRIRRDISAIIKPAAPAPFAVTATFDPGWKFSHASGRISSGLVQVGRVAISATAAEFSYAGTALDVRRILLKTPESEARGGYTMDTQTNDFRFLLKGALRPPDIAGWFSGWWPSFWSHFDFSGSSPPRADIVISGRWGRPYDTVIFLRADANNPVINTVRFDYLGTSLFIRPDFYDGLDLVATRGGGSARGTFTRSVDFARNALEYQSFDVTTTDLDLRECARIFGTVGTDIVEPFIFERPPRVTAVGRLTGPASSEGAHDRADVKIESVGPFTFMGFPLSSLSTHAVLNDDDLKLDNLRVGFANGHVIGNARLSGRGDDRRLGFDAALENGSLGQAIQTLETFGAFRKKESMPQASKFQDRLASGRLDLRLSGDGNYRDPYSFIGSGSGEINGAELAQINLLGGLSDVLRAVRVNFTSLRLNSAQANFKLDRRLLNFSEVKISGPSAAIDLTGLYRLDLQQMDFNARVSPFELSQNPFASAVEFVLTPFSNILELKLSGSIDKPHWRFAYGPSSLLHSLSGKKTNFQETPATPPASPTPPSGPQPPPSLRRR